ncbi:MAG TPA: AsmA-like C-terminal region-containing protein, partial [Chitinophagales bacterium]
YGDFDLSLIRSFPNFSFSINDVSVIGENEFKDDTLAYIKNFRFTLDLMTVLKSEKYKILAVILNEADINAVVNKDGKANWDIVKTSNEKTPESTENSRFSLEIKKYEINNSNIVYDDQQGKTFASISNLNFSGSGDVSTDIYDFITKTEIEALTVKSGAITYLNAAKIKGDNTISIDSKSNKYSFAKNEIDVNDLGLLFDGFVQINKDDYNLDVKFASKEATFKSILSLIPAVYKNDFANVKTAGTLKLDGNVKGIYTDNTYPAFNLDLQVASAMFQYPSLPTAVNNINIDAKISKEQGDLNKTFINVQKLHAEIGSDPIDARISVSTPISDPNVDLTLKGRLNLADVPKFYPIEDLNKISGLLVADLSFKGKQSDIEKKNYTAVKAAGTLSVTNLVYDSKAAPMPVNVSTVQMTFNPQNITLGSFAAKIGKSDFSANGSLDNYIAYLFNNGALHGNLNLTSNVLNVGEFLSKDTTTKTQTATAESEKYFQVPANIDFALNAKFGKIFYDKLELDNAKGQVSVKDETITLNNIYAELLGGNATIDASYSTAKSATPKVTFAYDIKNFDFQKTYQFVDMAPKLAPIIKYVQGNFSSDLKGSGSLKEDMSVDYNS